jgi:lipopolysaccharide transport protein LptA
MRKFLLVSAMMLLVAAVQAAQLATEQAMTVEFDSSELDLRNDLHQLHGNVRISQGVMSIASEEATASALQTDNSHWTFERSVHLQTAEADLKSNTATAQFVNGALVEAVVKGSPAVFEQRHAAIETQTRGRAGQIQYDFLKGIVRMTDDVWFSYGGNEFCGDVVVYNVRDERVTVNGGCENKDRVNIRIRPRKGVTIPSSTPRSGNESGA